ncbi:MAG: hypothetical protein ACKO6D_10920 [Rubrivivax sp.]
MFHQSQTPGLRAFVEMYAADRRTAREIGPVIGERYDLCEHLAQALARQLTEMEAATGLPSHAVRERVRTGLMRQGAIVTEPEAQWVMARLSGLLSWFDDEPH